MKSLLIHPEEVSEKWINKMVDLKVDTLAIHPWGGKNAYQTLENLLRQLEDPEYQKLIDYAVSCGLNVEYECHAAGYLLPRTLFETHPNYFRTNKEGVKTNDYNFCVSEPEVLRLLTENAAKLTEILYRSTDNYYFWLDDSKDAFCHCQKCKALSPSDQQMIALKAILKGIKQVNPNGKLAYLAYFECETPPETISTSEDIFLEYAPFLRDFSKSVQDGPASDIENIHKLLEFFGRKSSKVLEYWYDNSMFSKWKKPPVKFTPNNEIIKKDIAFYSDSGFEEIRSFACFLGADYEALYGKPDLSAFK